MAGLFPIIEEPQEKSMFHKANLEMRNVVFSTNVLDVARHDVKRYIFLELLVVDRICRGRSGLRFIGQAGSI
jgi:hypothetical protein